MNYQPLRNWILQSHDCAPFVVQNTDQKQDASTKDAEIAAICNTQTWATEIRDEYANISSLMGGVGAVMAASILDKLDAASANNSVLKWALFPLKTERGLNVGDHETRLRINSLIGIVLTEAEAVAVLALADKPINVNAADVSIALRGDATFTPGD